MLASSNSILLHSPPLAPIVLQRTWQLAPALPGVLVSNPGTPLPPGNLGLGRGVTGLGISQRGCSPKVEGMGTGPFLTMAA